MTVWDGNRTSMLSPGSTTQREMTWVVRLHKSGSRAPTDRSTALNTFAPSLPTHPPRPGPRRAISGRAISGDLGPRRVTSGDLAQSRAIPELHATPLHPTPPHPPPRRAILGDLGASLARRHTCSKKGRAWLEPRGSRGRARSVLAASPCATWAGEAAPPRGASLAPSRRPLRVPLIFSPLGVTLALTQGNPAVLPSPHLRRVRSVLRPLAPVHVPRARLPGLMPRPNQQHARLMPGPNPLPGWCQGSMNLPSVSPPHPYPDRTDPHDTRHTLSYYPTDAA